MPEIASSSPSIRRGAAGGRAVLALAFGTALLAVLLGPAFLKLYALNLLTRAFFVAIVAITVSLLWGATGFLTFGQSAFFGIGAYALAMTFTQFDFGPWQAVLGFALAILAAGLVAGCVGWISFYPGSTPLYATVISLVLPIVLVQLLYSGGEITGSSSGLVGFLSFDLDLATWFRIGGVSLLTVAVLAQVVLSSDAGRLLLAVRDNEARCAYLGIDTPKLRILLLMVCAMVAAAAGFGYAGFGAVAAPENAGFVFGTQLVVAVALGGRGSPIAAAIGAIAIEIATAYLSGILPFVWELLVGAAFILTVLLLPEGLFGGLPQRLTRPAKAARLTETARVPVPASTGAGRNAVVCKNVAKSFGALQVLRDVSLATAPGELVSLVGPNGAGKSTLMKCLADGRERSGGEIALFGHDIARLPPDRLVRFGLGRKFQMASVFESLTAAECLRIARTRFERPSPLGRAGDLALPASALRIVEMSGLRDRLDVPARDLSHGLKQALELAMVMALEPKVVLLDEPTAGLTRAERRRIGAILQDLCRLDGVCILLVEHDLDFVREISSRIVVLHQGRIVLDGAVDDVLASPVIEDIYAGAHAPAAAETRS